MDKINGSNFSDFISTKNINLNVKMSNTSKIKFNDSIKKLKNQISSDTKFLIVKIFIQLGQSEDNKTLDYTNKDNIMLFIQPKIKTYIEFKTKESAERYRQEELSENDLCLFLEVGMYGIGLVI